MMNDKTMSEFEREAAHEKLPLEKDADNYNDYIDPVTFQAWAMWQAAKGLYAPRESAIEMALRDLLSRITNDADTKHWFRHEQDAARMALKESLK